MRKITYRFVFNRKNKLNAKGKALLQVEAYQDRKKTYFSTRIYLKPGQWDARKGLIVRHPNASELNYRLMDFMIRLEQMELDLWKNGCEISLQALKQGFSVKEAPTFLAFAEDCIRFLPLKESTKQNQRTTLKLLLLFRRKAEFKDITPSFVFDFERFLYQKGQRTNTVAKHMKHLKAFVNAAIDRGFIDANLYPFRRYRIKAAKAKHSFLTPEELQKLEQLKLTESRDDVSHALDAFLFCCYTGLRYSDFIRLTEKNIVAKDGNPWMVFRTLKTGTEVKLPLHLLFEGKAWRLLQKHQGRWDDFFAIRANSTVNKDLAKIAKLAGIEKHFTFHSARHTNATLLIYKGTNITTVQKLLGHRNVSTTQIYSEVLDVTIIRDLQRCASR